MSMNEQLDPVASPAEATAPPPTEIRCSTIEGRRVVWPIAVGAASIMLASRDLLSRIISYTGVLIRTVITFFRNGGSLSSAFGNMDATSVLALLFGLLEFALPVLLILAGILLWRQRRRGVLMLRLYAVIAVLECAALTTIQAYQWQSQWSSLSAYYLVWPLLRATANATWPVFLLIWLSRPKVREEIRLWR